MHSRTPLKIFASPSADSFDPLKRTLTSSSAQYKDPSPLI
ncbi:hypothetical protein DB44_FF00210 [Candidatus Protochlamydia amoebophila]|uniref:Uncharacterized protein n=1 Tax=Candidatus Protochlamydia amoebophila TaxID=362787 RepID=A0A0C1JHP8_9BACT|nr:hypothetical protein DB44_FF00210 [Candidatus Protochlamydia amoebophila]